MPRANRPFPLEKERSAPWPGVKAPDPMRTPEHPHSSFPGGHQAAFADGGMIGGLPEENFKDGGKVKKKREKLKPEDLGSGLANKAGSALKGRELQLLNAERAAEGLPPLKHNPKAKE